MDAEARDAQLIEEIIADSDSIVWRLEHFSMTEDSFIRGRTPEEEAAYDSVMNPVYRVVENALKLSDGTQMNLENCPWDDIRGFRNRVAHDYANIDRRIAWIVVSRDIPQLAEAIRKTNMI